jgi:hypothetical protein
VPCQLKFVGSLLPYPAGSSLLGTAAEQALPHIVAAACLAAAAGAAAGAARQVSLAAVGIWAAAAAVEAACIQAVAAAAVVEHTAAVAVLHSPHQGRCRLPHHSPPEQQICLGAMQCGALLHQAAGTGTCKRKQADDGSSQQSELRRQAQHARRPITDSCACVTVSALKKLLLQSIEQATDASRHASG